MKGYVDEHNNTVFICPDCGFEKQFNASSFQNRKKSVKIKCRCGRTTEMEIEFRQYFRKKVELFGTCLVRKNQKIYDIIVRNLSIKGINFELLHVDRKYMADIYAGDIVDLKFQLDTPQSDMISKRCIVRAKSDEYIGAEFQDDNFSKRLGFYLG